MGIKSKTLIVRVDERTYMLLDEISQLKRIGMSVIVRTMLLKGLREIVDEKGNLKLEEDEKKDSVQPGEFPC